MISCNISDLTVWDNYNAYPLSNIQQYFRYLINSATWRMFSWQCSCIHFFCVIFALRQRKGRTSQYGLLSMLRRQLCVSSWHRFFIRDKVQQKYLRCHKWLSMFRSCFGALNWMRPILYSAKFFFWTFDSQRTIWLMKYIYCALTWLPPTRSMFSWQCSCIHSSCMIFASRQRQWRTSQYGLLSMLRRQLCVSQWQRFFIRCIKLQKAPTLS